MNKKLLRNRTSSPRINENSNQVSSPKVMNDSFLEDLELVSEDLNAAFSVRRAERYVTTRDTNSPSVVPISEVDEFQILVQRQDNVDSPTINVKESAVQENNNQDKIEKSDCIAKEKDDVKKRPENKSKSLENKSKCKEVKLKAVENKVQTQDEQSTRLHDVKCKAQDKARVKDRTRRSGNSKESNRCSDPSSKENNRPTDLSRESGSQLETIKDRNSLDNQGKKLDSKEKLEPIALLSAIKELVSTYTKQESTKILRAVQELHINSQANLIKHLLCQTDEIIKEMHPSSNSTRLKAILEENENLRESIAVLKIRNEELQRKVAETELIKEENIALKLKCKELSKKFG